MCQEPIFNIFEDSTCVLHIELPLVPRTYTKRKYESETEEEEEKPKTEEQGLVIEDFENALDVNIIENNVTISHSPVVEVDQDIKKMKVEHVE